VLDRRLGHITVNLETPHRRCKTGSIQYSYHDRKWEGEGRESMKGKEGRGKRNEKGGR